MNYLFMDKFFLLKLTVAVLLVGWAAFSVRKGFKNKDLDIPTELKKGNFAVAIVAAAITLGLAIVLSSVLLGGTAYGAENPCIGLNLRNNIYMPYNAKIVAKKDISGVCQVTLKIKNYLKQDQYIPLYATNKFVLVGSMFIGKKNVTDSVITKLQNEKVKKSLASASSYFKYYFTQYKPKNANGKYLYAFVDPLCPFCRRIEPYLKGLADKSGYTVRMYFMIVHGKPAYNKAESFICSGKGFSSYIKDAKNLDYGTGSCKKGKLLLKEDARLDSIFSISGTPTFITSAGKQVIGANLQGLRAIIGLKPIVHLPAVK